MQQPCDLLASTATLAGARSCPCRWSSPAAGALAAKVDPRWLLTTVPVVVASGLYLDARIGSPSC